MSNKIEIWKKLVNEEEGKWYYIWVKEHKSGFHVHANYAYYKDMVPVDGSMFWLLEYGMWNNGPHATLAGAHKAMCEKADEKIAAGYRCLDYKTDSGGASNG